MLDDHAELEFGRTGLPSASEVAEDSLVYAMFPARHRRAYDITFFRRVGVCAVKVSEDLADPNGDAAACTAQEIIRGVIGRRALALCDDAGLARPCRHPDELLWDGVDFENLVDEAMDPLEGDPAHRAVIGVEVAAVGDWFTPFNDHRIVHPYVRTEPTHSHVMHDLRDRLTHLMAEEYDAIDWSRIDSSEPLKGLSAISEVVELARHDAARESVAGVWIADPAHAEDSFHDLVRATTLSEHGSGC